MRPLRLMIYDETCNGRGVLPGLTQSWIAGALLYRGLGRLDAAHGARSWDEALAWLAGHEPGHEIGEIQYWGHGKWGQLYIAREILDVSALSTTSPLRPRLDAIRARMAPGASWWFRTCETFGARTGHEFAMAWTDFFERPAAGHTFIIGPWQSGLHSLAPGEVPTWDEAEGIEAGTARAPEKALWSGPGRPNTITCLGGRVPAGW
jgi:hypothetical protein